MVSLALWIPFGILFLIVAVVFAIGGYRHGVWNALVSLGATLVSLVLSVLLSDVVAAPLAGMIVKALADAMGEGGAVPFVLVLVKMVTEWAMTLVLFVLLFFLLVILTKTVAKILWRDSLACKGAAGRWAGLAVRLADAAVYVMVMLLPLYGTLGAYLPGANTVMDLLPQARNSLAVAEFSGYVDSVVEHPLTQLCSAGPLEKVYQRLSTVEMGGSQVNLTKVSQTLEKAAGHYAQLVEYAQNWEIDEEKVEVFVVFLRGEVVNQPWFHTLYQELYRELEAQTMQSDPQTREALELLDMDSKSLQENCEALLGLLQFGLEKGVLTQTGMQPQERLALLYQSGFMTELGSTINVTAESRGLRYILVEQAVDRLTQGDTEATKEMMQAYDNRQLTKSGDLVKDAEAMLLLLDASNPTSIMEGLMRLPGFDEKMIRDYFMSIPVEQLLGFDPYTQPGYTDLENALQVYFAGRVSVQDVLWFYMVAISETRMTSLDGSWWDDCNAILDGLNQLGVITWYTYPAA